MSSIHLSPSFVTAAVLTDYNTQLNQLRQEVASQRLELASLRLQFANFVKDEEVDAVKSTHQIQNSSQNCFYRYFSCFRPKETIYESKRRQRINRTTTITESGEKIVPSLFLRFSQQEIQAHSERGTGADSAIETPISTPTFRLHDERNGVGNVGNKSTATIIQPNPLSLINSINSSNSTTIEQK